MSANQKKLFTNIILLVLVNFLIKPFWTFGIDVKVLNTIGTQDYGLYYAVFNFSFLFHIFIDIGINQFHNREIAHSPEKLRKQYSQLFSLKMFFAFVYVFITFLFAYFIRYNAFQFKLLLLLGINQIIHSFVLYNRANFTALFRFKLDTFFSVFDKILSILICVYIFWFSPIQNSLASNFKIEYYIYTQTFALGLSFIVSLIILLNSEKIEWIRIRFIDFVPYLKKTLPFAVAVLLMALYTRIDAIMIERLLPEEGKYQAGIYASGYKILDALNQLPFLFASFLIPVFTRMLKQNEDFKPIFFAAIKMLLCISIGATITSIFWGENILKILYNEYTREWFDSFLYLMFSFNTAVLIYASGGLLTAHNKLVAISKMAMIALVINIILNYFLILKHGASGASLATLITQSSMVIMQFLLVFKLWNFKFSFKYFGAFGIYTTALFIASYYLQSNLFAIFIVVVLAILLALSMNLIEWRIFLDKKLENKQTL